MNDLKPCPFCGGKAEIKHDTINGDYYYVSCTRCLAQGRWCEGTEQEAADAWNRRLSCKECKHYEASKIKHCGRCDIFWYMVPAEYYCGDWSRKDCE